jgi:hypothetical protein
MNRLTRTDTYATAIFFAFLAYAAPLFAQTDLGCRTLVAPSATGRPRPTFTDFNPADGTNDRCILDKMTWSTGIMTGCDTDKYCPSVAITREEMAVYLLNGLFPSTPNAPQDPFPSAVGAFDDVPADYPLACFIEKLRSTGITAGCGSGTTYCPSIAIPRQQMAVFLVKTRHYYEVPAFVPPACQGDIFEDVTCTTPYDKWIEQLYRDGITAGCNASPLRFCPDATVTRWEMTIFLRKTFFPGPCQ